MSVGETIVIGAAACFVAYILLELLACFCMGLASIAGYIDPEYEKRRGYEGNTYYDFENNWHARAYIGEFLVGVLVVVGGAGLIFYTVGTAVKLIA